jgi:hypothetical protein
MLLLEEQRLKITAKTEQKLNDLENYLREQSYYLFEMFAMERR